MHFALYRLPLIVSNIQANQACGYLRRTLRLINPNQRLLTPSSTSTRFVAQEINMATPKESSSRLSVQLKTTKGTRDWFGADVILRDHILYVKVEEFNFCIFH